MAINSLIKIPTPVPISVARFIDIEAYVPYLVCVIIGLLNIIYDKSILFNDKNIIMIIPIHTNFEGDLLIKNTKTTSKVE